MARVAQLHQPRVRTDKPQVAAAIHASRHDAAILLRGHCYGYRIALGDAVKGYPCRRLFHEVATVQRQRRRWRGPVRRRKVGQLHQPRCAERIEQTIALPRQRQRCRQYDSRAIDAQDVAVRFVDAHQPVDCSDDVEGAAQAGIIHRIGDGDLDYGAVPGLCAKHHFFSITISEAINNKCKRKATLPLMQAGAAVRIGC
jgi:hypothetical protein